MIFRNPYDKSGATWSRTGRVLQVEYAMEAVKKGSIAVGVRSKTHVALACLLHKPFSVPISCPKKILKMDDHIGIATAGMAADGRVLSQYLQLECVSHKFIYDSPIPVGRLVLNLANKEQASTNQHSKRPYGVGLLVAGLDASGAHLYYNCPSGNYFEYKAFAIGSRCEAVRTYFEEKTEDFDSFSRDDVIKEAFFGIKRSQGGYPLDQALCTAAVVGVDEPFHLLDEKSMEEWIDDVDILYWDDNANYRIIY